MSRLRILGMVVFGLQALLAIGQIESLSARLLTDTLAIGRPFEVEVEVFFPAASRLLIPPVSAWVDAPFECFGASLQDERSQGEVTRSVWRLSVRSFDVATVQAVQVRAVVAGRRDTVTLTALTDSARLISRIPEDARAASFRFQPEWDQLIDPPPAGKVPLWPLATLLALVLGGWAAWKPLRKLVHLRRHLWEWQRLRRQLKQLQQTATHDQIGALSLIDRIWKHYLDPESMQGIRSLSTTELRTVIQQMPGLNIDHQQALLTVARLHDQVVYAGEPVDAGVLNQTLQQIYRTLEYVYLRRRQLIRQGKPINMLGQLTPVSRARA